MILTGNTLGKRQLELNLKVNEAAAKKVKFEEQVEKSDVDKLFKIDLASKYKNLDYIVEVLKSGDSLYISRALKCIWIYDDQYSNIINPDYLHDFIFPHMSIKMKKKMLATLPLYVRNEERAAMFYTYCMNANMTTYANKYLPFTSKSFKKDVIENNINLLHDIEPKNLRFFIGNSFQLAKAFMNKTIWKNKALSDLRYLYSVSDVRYLELLEEHASMFRDEKNVDILGLRLSRNIIKLHKLKILKDPVLYVNILNKNVLIKHSSIDELKSYAVKLLPETSNQFWSMNYCRTYEHIFNAIPDEERFEFTKKIFTSKYLESFEMNIKFYNQDYYKYMTIHEREEWALRHLASKDELLGAGNNYIWYKFINFDKAFPEIKKYVLITPDSDKRAEIVQVLIESVKNQDDLTKLLNYYYERHVNEIKYKKEIFLDKVMALHKVFDFGENCWAAFNKLLYSLDVYNPLDQSHNVYRHRIVALVYYIINNIEFPTGLQKFVDSSRNAFAGNGLMFHYFISCLDQLDKERKESVYQYVMKFYVKKIMNFDNREYNNDLKLEVREHIRDVLSLMKYYEKPNEDCPEIVKKYMKLDSGTFYPKETKTITPGHILRLLKQDAVQVVSELPAIQHYIEHSWDFKINQLLKKLRIYFVNDIAQNYMEYFMKCLSEPESGQRKIFTAVYGIFQLADDKAKSDFMAKYAPLDSKIDHSAIDRTVLYIQEAICRFACYSRPTVPLSNISMYIKGDYLRYCLPMITSYSSNLSLPLCMRFAELLLNSPVSVQKHGLRLVFHCFNTENLKRILLHAWTQTKNISLRKVIFTSLFNHIVQQDKIKQVQLYETLKIFALSLHQDDDNDVLHVFVSGSNLHESIKGDYFETAWITINKFTDNTVNLEYKTQLVNNIETTMEFMSKIFIRKIIDEHVNTKLTDKEIKLSLKRDGFYELDNAKWQLVAKYIVTYVEDQKNAETILELVKFIIKKCLKRFNFNINFNHEIDSTSYTLRQFFHEFIDTILNKHYNIGKVSYSQINHVLEAIIIDLRDTLPLHERYGVEWYLQLAIITNKAFDEGKVQCCANKESKNKVMKDIALNYALELGKLVSDLVEKQLFFSSYLSRISDMVKDNLNNIINVSGSYEHDTVLDDMCVFVGVGMMNFKIVETALITTSILPIIGSSKSDILVSGNQYHVLVDDIKKFNSREIQCLFYQKFVTDSFMKDFY